MARSLKRPVSQFRALSYSQRGYQYLEAAGLSASIQTQRQWLLGEKLPSHRNARIINRAYQSWHYSNIERRHPTRFPSGPGVRKHPIEKPSSNIPWDQLDRNTKEILQTPVGSMLAESIEYYNIPMTPEAVERQTYIFERGYMRRDIGKPDKAYYRSQHERWEIEHTNHFFNWAEWKRRMYGATG